MYIGGAAAKLEGSLTTRSMGGRDLPSHSKLLRLIRERPRAAGFAGQLYNSLGFGRSLGLAFDQAKLQVQLTFNAVSGNPTLTVTDGLDANDIIIVSPVEPIT